MHGRKCFQIQNVLTLPAKVISPIDRSLAKQGSVDKKWREKCCCQEQQPYRVMAELVRPGLYLSGFFSLNFSEILAACEMNSLRGIISETAKARE